jgi:hypothetical protein
MKFFFISSNLLIYISIVSLIYKNYFLIIIMHEYKRIKEYNWDTVSFSFIYTAALWIPLLYSYI